MAAQLRTVTSQTNSTGRTQPPPETTDKGLVSSSLHAQGSKPREDPKDTPAAGGERAARVEVKTAADAQKVAERPSGKSSHQEVGKVPGMQPDAPLREDLA